MGFRCGFPRIAAWNICSDDLINMGMGVEQLGIFNKLDIDQSLYGTVWNCMEY